MIVTLLFVAFLVLMFLGVPIGAALGLAGAACIALANMDVQWFGLLAVPQNFYAGLGKYPLLAIPMFVLVGSIFDRSGVAARLVNFAVAIVGRGPGMLPLVAICVAMFMGGISGSGPATAAAVGGVMIAAMARAGYPAPFSASVVAGAAATDILIPPSVAFIVYSVLVPGASVPALFAAGVFPGILAGLALIIPAVWMARRHKMGQLEASLPRPPFWKSLREAIWGLAAPVVILGGMRAGWFTPTEAAVVAVIDPITRAIVNSGLGETGILALLIVMLLVLGMFLDGISILLIFVPLLAPLMLHFQWDVVWFGVLLVLTVAIGQFTPPMAVNLMVASKIAAVRMEQTTRWVIWLVLAMCVAMLLVAVFPQIALWLPQRLGY